jgi:hypothetical protein
MICQSTGLVNAGIADMIHNGHLINDLQFSSAFLQSVALTKPFSSGLNKLNRSNPPVTGQ